MLHTALCLVLSRQCASCRILDVVLCRSADYAQALALYEKCPQQAPQDVQILSNLAAVHLCLENWPEALEHARKGLSIDPIKCLYRSGIAAQHVGQYSKSIEALTLAKKLVSSRLSILAMKWTLANCIELFPWPQMSESCGSAAFKLATNDHQQSGFACGTCVG